MPGSWNRFAALSPDGTTLVSAGAHDHVFEAPRHLILHDLLTATSIEFGEAWLRSAPTISSDNARIAFDSSEDLTGDNPDRHTEIFVFNTSTGSLRQITSDPSYSSSSPRFLAAPRTLTFVSRREVGGSNSAHRRRTFLHDLRSRATTPLPSVVADGLVSGDGSSVAFTSTADLVGANDDANAELFTYDLASGVVGQHTSTTDEGHRPWAISDAGDLIALATPTDDTNRHHDLAIATTCAPAPRADAQLATATARRYAGEDIYAVHPVPAQRLQVPIAPGTSRSFLVRLQNDRAVPDALAVSGRDAGRPGYSVQYRQNGSDVTALVEAGDYTTGVLGTGASVVLQVKITADESVPRNARHRVDVTARSVANPVAGDAVRAQVTAVR
jgi:hypothetical protein